MPKIKFVGSDGDITEVEAVVGSSVMIAARDASIRGIEAECAGALSCGTCHVYVIDPYLSQLPLPSVEEMGMLEFVEAERKVTSRLSCQLSMTAELDGLTIVIPVSQT